MRTALIQLVFLCIVSGAAMLPQNAHAVNYACGHDFNGDGYADAEGETAYCSASCTPDYTYNDLTCNCEALPECPGSGIYNTANNLCEDDVITRYTCSTTGTIYASDQECMSGCTTGGTCAPAPFCNQHYLYSGGKCISEPSCPEDGILNIETDLCEMLPATTCPLGNYVCVNFCTYPPEHFGSELGGFHDDSEINPANGECMGEVYIFSGNAMECRKTGVQTGFHNCCTDPLEDRGICNDEEIQLEEAEDAGTVHYVGTYCKERWWLIGCVQRAKVYCVFNSKLGRIVHEEGRTQLLDFGSSGGWGSAEHPHCEGFTPEEFQMLDFSQMDLSEFFRDIETEAIGDIQEEMRHKIEDFYQDTQ